MTHAKLPLLEVSKMLSHSSTVVTAKVCAHFVQDRGDDIQRALSAAHVQSKTSQAGASQWSTESAASDSSEVSVLTN